MVALHTATTTVARTALAADATPLRVKVAIALGWTDITMKHPDWYDGLPPGTSRQTIPRFGEDSPEGWAATGPLVSRYGISLMSPGPENSANWEASFWAQRSNGYWENWDERSVSPCEAIANLIIALAEAGKLTEVK